MKIFLPCLLIFFLSYNLSAKEKVYSLNFANSPLLSIPETDKDTNVIVILVKELFKRANFKYTIIHVPLTRGMSNAQNRDYSCVFPAQRAQDIEAEYQWISPLFVSQSAFYSNRNSNIKLVTLADARKYRIGVLHGSGDGNYLKTFGFKMVEEVSSEEQNVKMLEINRIDLWATNSVSMDNFLKYSQEKVNLPKEILIFRKTLGSIACNNKIPVSDIEKLQKTLINMIKDGSLNKITSGKL